MTEPVMASEAASPPGRSRLRAAGAVEIGPLALPFSSLASEAARDAFVAEIRPPPAAIRAESLALRAYYDVQNSRLAAWMRTLFAVEVEETEIGGVRVHRVSPAEPKAENRGRALICLHGGGFMWGAGSGALVEAIPIAAEMGVDVFAVDYRLAPEHRYPAASEDVAAVWRALLERYAPSALGVFGCSAGAILTAQSTAWLLAHGLPAPGAIAMLGGGAGDLAGDSAWLGPALTGEDPPPGGPMGVAAIPYFAGAAWDDPCLSPADHPDVLARFPPTLLIAGGRDFAASSVTDLHLRLDAAGVDARLFLFDGLWHAFHIFPHLPESRRVYQLIAAFFDRALAPGTPLSEGQPWK
ncbi:MAG TPA: alpha/beta hydrolase fold domain-containing protein [Caulobacteraceae bacterium]